MPYYLFLARSITHAQRMSNLLEQGGVSARIFRPPLRVSERGCSYALYIFSHQLRTAKMLLREAKLYPTRVLVDKKGEYSEVSLFP